MRKAVEIFGKWAEAGKDIGMEKGHAASVNEMLNFALKERALIGEGFSFLDVGCGNGWVPRLVKENALCRKAIGIDGAEQMIANALSRGGDVEYIYSDIATYNPKEQFDVIHSMEVLYYLQDPKFILERISRNWLAKGGRIIAGIDHYYENIESHAWEKKVGTPMLMLKEREWVNLFKSTGLSEVEFWRSNPKKNWSGTLVLTGKKN